MAHRTQGNNYVYCTIKDMIKYTDEQSDEEVHSTGDAVRVELGYTTLLAYICMCSHTQILSEPCASFGNFM